MISESDDSVIINRHPFSVKRSDFDQKEAYQYNSIDQYNIGNDDSDSDLDSGDSDKNSDSDDNVKIDLKEDNVNRKRNSYLVKKVEIERIDDIENEIEVEEYMCEEDIEEIAVSFNHRLLSIDEESELDDSVETDMTPTVDNKNQTFDDKESTNSV